MTVVAEPHIHALRMYFYGGTTQGEKDFLVEAYALGVSAADILDVVVNGGGGGGGGLTSEEVRDLVATFIVAGNNVDTTHDDAGNTLTIDVEALTIADIASLQAAIDAKEATGVAAALVDDLSGITNASAARGNLGLGTAAVVNTGTSGANVPTVTQADARFAPIAAQLKPTALKTANYTAVPGDYVPVDTTSGVIVVTLPTAPADGTVIAVKRVVGPTNAVTVNAGGSDVFNVSGGSTSASISVLNQMLILVYRATGAIWYVETAMSLGGLDARYRPYSPRVTSIVSSATPTFNTDTCDAVSITALATAITSMTSGMTGTPTDFQHLTVRIKDDGTARAITWGASFASRGATLPTTTVLSKLTTVGLIYNSVTSIWGCVSVAQET